MQYLTGSPESGEGRHSSSGESPRARRRLTEGWLEPGRLKANGRADGCSPAHVCSGVGSPERILVRGIMEQEHQPAHHPRDNQNRNGHEEKGPQPVRTAGRAVETVATVQAADVIDERRSVVTAPERPIDPLRAVGTTPRARRAGRKRRVGPGAGLFIARTLVRPLAGSTARRGRPAPRSWLGPLDIPRPGPVQSFGADYRFLVHSPGLDPLTAGGTP